MGLNHRLLLFVAFASGRVAPMARAQDPIVPDGDRFGLTAAVLTGAALALDEPLRAFAAAHQTRGLSHAAEDVDPLGRAEYLVPSLVAAVVVPAAISDWPLARSALRIGAGYVVSDLAGGALRLAAGRYRPDSTGNPWRFRPLRPQGDWGSLPSAHVTHAFAIAAGIAEESGRPWAAGLAYGIASVVGVQRVYRQAHWASDVVVGATLSIALSRRVVRILDR
jgi:membrane-associated phospholipid phosphatase